MKTPGVHPHGYLAKVSGNLNNRLGDIPRPGPQA